MDDIFNGLGVEVRIRDEDFLKIKETLTRIGISSKKEKKLFQSCCILHKQGRYAIFHFKEMFALDGRETNFSEEDEARRNKIIELLEDWGLLEVMDSEQILEPIAHMNQIKVISYKEKDEWQLEQKYNMGRIKR